jgi:hypothetical protein
MLSRKTQKQLLQDLLARSAMPNNRRASLLAWTPLLLLVILALYLFAKI